MLSKVDVASQNENVYFTKHKQVLDKVVLAIMLRSCWAMRSCSMIHAVDDINKL